MSWNNHKFTEMLIEENYINKAELELVAEFNNWFGRVLNDGVFFYKELKVYIEFFSKTRKSSLGLIENKFNYFVSSINNSQKRIGHKFAVKKFNANSKGNRVVRHSWIDEMKKKIAEENEN